MRIAIVAGTVHHDITDDMVAVAEKALVECGAVAASIIRVPGSYEVPPVVKQLLENSEIDGAVVLGAIERGETLHGHIMGQVVHQALMDIQLELGKPIGFGIIGPGAMPKQMHERKNKMALAAVHAVLELIRLKH